MAILYFFALVNYLMLIILNPFSKQINLLLKLLYSKYTPFVFI